MNAKTELTIVITMQYVQTSLGNSPAIANPATEEMVLHAEVTIMIFFFSKLTIFNN